MEFIIQDLKIKICYNQTKDIYTLHFHDNTFVYLK